MHVHVYTYTMYDIVYVHVLRYSVVTLVNSDDE